PLTRSCTRSGRRALTRICSGRAAFVFSRPLSRASPMLPAPMKPSVLSVTMSTGVTQRSSNDEHLLDQPPLGEPAHVVALEDLLLRAAHPLRHPAHDRGPPPEPVPHERAHLPTAHRPRRL